MLQLRYLILAAVVCHPSVSAWSVTTDADKELVQIDSQELFVPSGFDDNDDVIVYLHGVVNNTCWKLVEPQKTETAPHSFSLAARATWIDDGRCRAEAIQFTLPVNLGVLPAATYHLSVDRGAIRKTLAVREARRSYGHSDEALYAPVESVAMEVLAGKIHASLWGTFPNTCLRIKQVTVKAPADQTIDILPVVEMMAEDETTGLPCQAIDTPFVHRVAIQDLPAGRYLFHVRSLDRNAVVAAFEVKRPAVGGP